MVPAPTTSIGTGARSPRSGVSSCAAGCDPVRLRTQAIVTPECGLSPHTVEQADRMLGLSQDLADRVLDQAVATKFSLGA